MSEGEESSLELNRGRGRGVLEATCRERAQQELFQHASNTALTTNIHTLFYLPLLTPRDARFLVLLVGKWICVDDNAEQRYVG